VPNTPFSLPLQLSTGALLIAFAVVFLALLPDTEALTQLALYAAAGLAFMFVGVVLHVRRRPNRSDGRLRLTPAPSSVPSSGHRWFTIAMTSPLFEVPQLVVAATVVATFQPLSVLLGSLVASIICMTLGAAAPRTLQMLSRLAQRASAPAFGIVGLAGVGLGAAAALGFAA
jgi:hypothetical protein